MESNIFMRGDPLDLKALDYYIIGRSNGIYYYFTTPYNNTSVKATMTSSLYSTIKTGNLQPIKIAITKTASPNSYSFKGGSSYYPLVTNTSGVLDLSSTSTSQSFFLYAIDALNSDGSNLYPGIWYSIYTSDSLIKPSWYEEICSTSNTPFCNITLTSGLSSSPMDIMFIPENLLDKTTNGQGPYTINKWGIYQGVHTCIYDTLNPDIGLVWFQYFITNDPKEKSVNCSSGYVDSTSYNCYFTNNDICNNGYLYQVCNTSTQTCGECLGICDVVNDNMKPCLYDFNINSENTETNTQLSCNPKTPEPSNKNEGVTLFIVFMILILLIIFAVVGFVIYKVYKNNKNNVTYAE